MNHLTANKTTLIGEQFCWATETYSVSRGHIRCWDWQSICVVGQ